MQGPLSQHDLVDRLANDAAALLTTAREAGPDAAVPACPGWTVRDLVGHLATEYESWAAILETSRTDPPDDSEPARLATAGEIWSVFESAARRIVAAGRAADPATPVWCDGDGGADDVAGRVIRRLAQETAMHRVDVDQAAGRELHLDPVFAADGIDEFLTAIYPFRVRAGDAPGGSIHLHCTDTEGEWTIASDGTVSTGHAKGDVALRGRAADLLTVIWRRQPLDAVEVFGDRGLAVAFVGATDRS